MTEVICLDDSDDDAGFPPKAFARPEASRQGQQNDSRTGRFESACGNDDFDDDDDDDDLGIFTDRHHARKNTRVVSGAQASTATASRAAQGQANATSPSVSARDRIRLEKASAKAADAAKRALDAETAKLAKADAKEMARQSKEREEILRVNAKHVAQLVGGKMKLQQITVVMSADLGPDDFGRCLRDTCDLGVQDGTKGVTPLLHTTEQLPLHRSVTWRYHAPSTTAVGLRGGVTRPEGAPPIGQTAAADDVRSAQYTLVHLTGESFVDKCAADHVAVQNGVVLPANGLQALLQKARSELPNHTLGLVIEGLRQHCSTRERREFRAVGVNGFSRKNVESAMARLSVEERGIRVTSVTNRPEAINHFKFVSVALAKRPYEKEIGFLDILPHSKGTTITPAASLALEAAAAGGSRGRGVGNDGGGLFASQQTRDAGAAPSRGKTKSCTEIWCGALMTIDGCAEPAALAIVRAFPTMQSLMVRYDSSSELTEREKKKLLQNLIRVVTSDTQTVHRKVGPVLSARVFSILKPRDLNDVGDEIVGVGA